MGRYGSKIGSTNGGSQTQSICWGCEKACVLKCSGTCSSSCIGTGIKTPYANAQDEK